MAIAYADEAIADKSRSKFCRWLRSAAERFHRDLKRAAAKKNPPFTFDPFHANDACDFIEKLQHIEGTWKTPNIVLHPSHVFFVVQLFGFRDKDGFRRFKDALFCVARKNAKSTLAAAILLYCMCVENEPGGQIITGATTFTQAAVIFNIAKAMVLKDSDMREAFGLEVWSKSISRMDAGAGFKPIHSKASTQDGLNPSIIGLDEIHAHKSPELRNVLKSAAGARRNALMLYTTTEGYPNAGPWADLRHLAKQILNQVLGEEMDHFLVVYYSVDEEDKEAGIEADADFDETKWIKANPLLDVNPKLLDAIKTHAAEAKVMPSILAEFYIKRLNRQSAPPTAWISLPKWRLCAGKVDLDFLTGKPCTAGLDLSSTTDLCSLRVVWKVDGHYYTWGRRWIPSAAISQRHERGSVNYAGWVAAGLVEETEGEVVDYAIVEAAVEEVHNRFHPTHIAYDPWNATDIVNRLVAKSIPMVKFIQGPQSYHPAMQELERHYIPGKLSTGGDLVLQWCMSNMIARRDINLNMAPDKKRSPDKIDDGTALLMGIGVGLTGGEKPPEHQMFFIG